MQKKQCFASINMNDNTDTEQCSRVNCDKPTVSVLLMKSHASKKLSVFALTTNQLLWIFSLCGQEKNEIHVGPKTVMVCTRRYYTLWEKCTCKYNKKKTLWWYVRTITLNMNDVIVLVIIYGYGTVTNSFSSHSLVAWFLD